MAITTESEGRAESVAGAARDVFISYSSKDVAAAEKLQGLLEVRGITVWRDKERLDLEATGQPYTPAIRAALDKAKKVVVLWSPRSVASTWVHQEAAAALKAKKIVPLLIEACELPFPHALNHTIRIDDLATRIDVIARAIGADIPGGGLVTPPDAIRYRLPTSGKAEELIGRNDELTKLFTAWDFGETRVFVLDAMGGAGKTALVNALLQGLETTGWRGAQDVYTWSFYSQGAREESNISSDEFMNEALDWFGYAGKKPIAEMKSWQKGEALAKLIAARRTLLILDGIEPLQYPAHNPGLAGQIKQNDGLKELLDYLALHSKGLAIVTTRVPVVDLSGNPEPRVLRPRLQPLSTSAGVQLLRRLGVDGTLEELEHTVSGHADPARGWPEGFNGHALSLKLLGNFLTTVHKGDIRQRDKVPGLMGADQRQGKHAFRVMKAYENHFESRIKQQVAEGVPRGQTAEAHQLAILHIMGLFDRPARADVVRFLRESRIPGLTEPLADLREDEWQYAVTGLRKLGLLNKPHVAEDGEEIDDGSLDAHPLVREYFEMRLKQRSAATSPPLPAGGERVGVRGGDLHDPRLGLPLTLTHSPSQVQGDGEWGRDHGRGAGVYEAAHGALYDFYRYLGLPEEFRTPANYAALALCTSWPEDTDYYKRELADGRVPRGTEEAGPPTMPLATTDERKAAATLIRTDVFARAKRVFAPQLGHDGTATEILERMGASFSAIAHGCKAGRYDEAFKEVYMPRVSRGDDHFAAHRLGAHGANLAALVQFFAEPFARPAGRNDASPGGLSEADQALVLNIAGFALRAQGRLAEAVASFRAGVKRRVVQENWVNAAADSINLSELLLTLGRVTEALAAGEAAVAHAGRFASEARSRQDIEAAKFMRIVAATTHADALGQAGRLVEAGALLDRAEAQQAEWQPHLPLHYSLQGYRLCDQRLAQGRAGEVLARAGYVLAHSRSLLDTALATLTLGRAHAALAAPFPRPSRGEGSGEGRPHTRPPEHAAAPHPDPLPMPSAGAWGEGADHAALATRHLDAAVDKLRDEADRIDHLPRSLIARAAWLRANGEHALALDHLTKALDLAERSDMRLFRADALIERARLALAMGDAPAAAEFVVAARKVIDSTFVDHSAEPPRRTPVGYARRNVDLHLVEATICLADDPESAAQSLAKAAALVEAGYWGSLPELTDLTARSGLDDGGAIARLTVARAAFDTAADAAFDAALNDYPSDDEINARLADPEFRQQLIDILRANGHDFARMPIEEQRYATREVITYLKQQQQSQPARSSPPDIPTS